MIDVYNEIAKEFPEIARLNSIGKSFEGWDIVVLELGTFNILPNGTSIMINSLHHSWELVGLS